MGGKKRSKHDGSCLTRTCRFSKTAKRTFNILLSFPFLFFFFWLRFGYTVYWKCCVCVWVPAEKRAKNEQSTGSNRMWTYKLEKRERERDKMLTTKNNPKNNISPSACALYEVRRNVLRENYAVEEYLLKFFFFFCWYYTMCAILLTAPFVSIV